MIKLKVAKGMNGIYIERLEGNIHDILDMAIKELEKKFNYIDSVNKTYTEIKLGLNKTK